MTFEELNQNIIEWGRVRGIVQTTDAQVSAQFKKLDEELHELKTAFQHLVELHYGKIADEGSKAYPKLEEKFLEDYKLELGDLLVTIIMVAVCSNVDPVDCLERAYAKIKSRTGRVVDGIFVKDDSIHSTGC